MTSARLPFGISPSSVGMEGLVRYTRDAKYEVTLEVSRFQRRPLAKIA